MTRRKRDVTAEDLRRARIPEKYWDVTFKAVPPTAPYRAPFATYLKGLDGFLANGEGLYLYSPVNGTGKTGLAVIALRWALAHGYTGFYTRSEAVRKATATGVLFDEHTSVDERMRDVDVLVLDDFGKEYRTEKQYIELVVEDLIRERDQRNKATILTANIDPLQVQSAFSGDLADVLKGSCAIIEVVGEDRGGKNWRKAKGESLMDRVYGEGA